MNQHKSPPLGKHRRRLPILAMTATVAVLSGCFSSASDPAEAGGALAATIRYTEKGVPHVLADDHEDAGFGHGYAAARDHLCTIGTGMVTFAGERSRYFGPDETPAGALTTASTNLSSDLYYTSINQSGVIERLIDQPAPLGPSDEIRDLVRGYAQGYNLLLAERGGQACGDQGWLRPMTEIDVYRRAAAWSTFLGQTGVSDALAEGPAEETAESGGSSIPESTGPDLSKPGSNSIALGGDVTESGRGISVANPHLPWGGDFLFHQAHITIPGEWNANGASFIGLPTITIGHNASFAWSGTIADATRPFTLFELTLSPDDPTAYLVDDEAVPMERRAVTVDTRTPEGDIEPVTRTQWWTEFGPVITQLRDLPLPWSTETAFVLADPNTANMRLLDSFYAVSRATDIEEFDEALRAHQGISAFNLLGADSQGDTAYSGRTVLPNVTDAHAERCNTELGRATYQELGVAVLDAAQGDCAWPVDPAAVQPGAAGPGSLPYLERRDYLVNSNESYWLTNPEEPVTGFARLVGTTESTRSTRTRGAITEITDQLDTGDFTPDNTWDLVFSNRSHSAELALGGTVEMCASLPGGRARTSDGVFVDVTEACSALAAWDGRMDVDSRGAMLFSRYWLPLARTPDDVLWTVPFDPTDPVGTPNTLNPDNPALATALADAVADLDAAGIAVDAPLGENQYVEWDGERAAIGGGRGELGVFNVVASEWNPDAGHDAIGDGFGSNTSSYVHVVAFDGGECPDIRTLTTYSQSSDPDSPHFADQTQSFAEKQWITGRFCEADIQASPQLEVLEISNRP
ncbi:penicillin acylase family protein [Actinoalloteichus hymeniacidonis]|uniref:Penicilin amidase n=1 Tax=Actinoalloteichus hymeniacidonis TaxID=340345 RepID=A0AAC9HPB5_9PSEU|nr:penicillin acylase family protein [Actinoalloteichus hymeniacidonis]AOS62075.1 penicilin amidase [Actinoalloteichus hymeniacidonis]MBB5909903.1 acyl-homoserine-lactone acylase [Actinoalloteichus hymeniacidonis]